MAEKYSLLSLESGFIVFSPGFHPAGQTSSGFSCTYCTAYTRRNHNQIHSESDASWSISWCWETRIQEHILHYSSQTPETKLAQITWYIHQNKQKGSYRKTPICMLGFGWLKEVVKHFQYFKYFHKSCEVELSNSPAAFGGSPQHFVQCQGCWWWRVGWCLAYQLWTILSRQFPAFKKPKSCV